MTVKIEVKNLTKIFGKNPRSALEKVQQGWPKEKVLAETGHTVGIRDASFQVHEGEVFVIMGLSGSGKSTLIRCLNLLNKPTAGEIYVDDENILDYDKKQLKQFRQEKLAMVFQHFGLLSHRTVLGNVEYGLEVRKVPKEKRQEIARQAIANAGLAGWRTKCPASSTEVCSSGWGWPAPWPTTRTFCLWTNLSAPWTR